MWISRKSAWMLFVGLLIAGCDGGSEPQQPRKNPEAPATAPQTPGVQAPPASRPAATAPLKIAPPSNAGFNPSSEKGNPAMLEGVWIAEGGLPNALRIVVVFKGRGDDKTLTWTETPMVGDERSRTEPYEIRGKQIRSDAILRDNTVLYRFAGEDKLEIEFYFGTKIVFQKKK